MKAVGNDEANKYWERNLSDINCKPNPNFSTDQDYMTFLYDKYIYKQFAP